MDYLKVIFLILILLCVLTGLVFRLRRMRLSSLRNPQSSSTRNGRGYLTREQWLMMQVAEHAQDTEPPTAYQWHGVWYRPGGSLAVPKEGEVRDA